MTRHLITSALPYINGIKHLGNLVGSLLPADVYARFLRDEGDEVLFLCATDEHGAPAELAAAEAGLPVAAYCEQQHDVQADIYRRFGLSFDFFGRSSNPSNHELTQAIFAQLDANGYIERRELALVYSPDDGRFLPDRYVIGTCPRCRYEAARGDQCENCTRLLDPTELVDPRSAISGSTNLEVRDSGHYFLRLDLLSDDVAAWVEERTSWPALSQQIARKWLAEGLRARCITRDLEWGVAAPGEGMEGKVFYVWFDAPIAYIAATRDWAEATDGADDRWRAWWTEGEDVRYAQFMGKDNLPFHTVMFPATLLGAGAGWKLADHVKGFHWMNYYGGKFSTSQGRGVFMDQALELHPADVWRWFLMSDAPESADFRFTWEHFAARINSDLAGVFGNFVNRVLRFSRSKFGDTIPEGGNPGPAEAALRERCAAHVEVSRAAFGDTRFREATAAIRALWTEGNAYIDDRAPWTAIKTDQDQAALAIRTCFNLIRLFAVAARPVIPTLAGAALDALRLTEAERAGGPADHLDLDRLAGGRPFDVIEPLVDKITPEQVEASRERFGSDDDA